MQRREFLKQGALWLPVMGLARPALAQTIAVKHRQVVAVAPPADPIAQIGTTQTATAAGGGTATTTGFDTTGATLLVIAVGGGGTAYTTTVSDSKGNTWQHLVSVYGDGSQGGIPGGGDLCFWYSYNHGGSALSVGAGHTVSISGNNYPAIAFAAFSGTKTQADNPFDVEHDGASTDSSATTAQPGSITPTVNGALVVTAIWQHTMNSMTISAPYGTPVLQNNTADSVGFSFAVQTTAAATNPTWTLSSGTSGMGAVIAAFKPQ